MSDNYYLYLGGSSGNFGWWGLRGVRPRPADIFLKNIPLKIVNETTNFIKTVVFGKKLHATLLNVVLHEV